MRFKNILIFMLVSIAINEYSFAQKMPDKSDSTQHKKVNIENDSTQSRFTGFFYRLFFTPTEPGVLKKVVGEKSKKQLVQEPYSMFEGKIIRNIYIETLAPFGYSIADTIEVSQKFLTKTGNKLHITSKQITIQKLLLFKKNQPFDSLLFKESERLVRRQKYVRDVSFVVALNNSDSVDVFIRELDNWSIGFKTTFSSRRFSLKLDDKNFLGFGHELTNTYTWFHPTRDNAFKANYFIPNISNTYISTTLQYGTDEFRNFTRSLAFDRSFFSPFTKWAGGVNFDHQFRRDSFFTNDSLEVLQDIKFDEQSYWVGHSTQLIKGNSEDNRTTRFISALRYIRTRYPEKPVGIYDPLQVFCDQDFYLASIGISARKYVQEKYVFKYGITEDVPIGKIFMITGGYQEKNNSGRMYLGTRLSMGKYYPWGYLSSNFEYGTFFRSLSSEQSVFTAGANYFTELFELRKWKFRQFAKSQLTIGTNRLLNESLTLNDGYGIEGFNSENLSGTTRILFTLQTQSYAPWNFIGFRFGPYFIYTLGMLGDATTELMNSKVYSRFGLGVLIKNESLVFNTFQFSVSFYPIIPGSGQNVVKPNAYKTNDFGFRDFEMGKPATMAFQ